MDDSDEEALFFTVDTPKRDICKDPFHFGKNSTMYQYASRECGMCGRKICKQCTRQGFQCIGKCSSFGCRHCESSTTALHCKGCA